MNKTPYYSVIIPALNEEKYLPKLIRTLSKQTFQDFEVIVVDGNSEDSTVEQTKKMENILPSLTIISSKRRSPAIQRNLGASKARGKYFVFFDADVLVPPYFFEDLNRVCKRKKPSFITTWLLGDNQLSSSQMLVGMYNIMMELAKFVGTPHTMGFNTIVQRSVFAKVGGYNEKMFLSDDHDFAMRVCKAGYDLTILKDPKLIMSLRRFRSEGTLHALQLYTKATIHLLLKGPFSKQMFKYPMGGHVHTKANSASFDIYARKMEQLEKKFPKRV